MRPRPKREKAGGKIATLERSDIRPPRPRPRSSSKARKRVTLYPKQRTGSNDKPHTRPRARWRPWTKTKQRQVYGNNGTTRPQHCYSNAQDISWDIEIVSKALSVVAPKLYQTGPRGEFAYASHVSDKSGPLAIQPPE